MAQDKSSVMLLVAGFFGSLVAVGKANHTSLRDNLLAISAGTSSAYFLTPVVFEVTGIAASSNVQSGMAFLLGVLGMRGVEMLIAKVFPDAAKPDATDA